MNRGMDGWMDGVSSRTATGSKMLVGKHFCSSGHCCDGFVLVLPV